MVARAFQPEHTLALHTHPGEPGTEVPGCRGMDAADHCTIPRTRGLPSAARLKPISHQGPKLQLPAPALVLKPQIHQPHQPAHPL